MGQVAANGGQFNGAATLALRFTEARLKSGQTVPIKATIVGTFQTDRDEPYDQAVAAQIPETWNDGTLAVDQIAALPGIDLHSRITSPNSGVFVSTGKDDIKLSPAIGMTLAIAARPAGRQNTSNLSSMNGAAPNSGRR